MSDVDALVERIEAVVFTPVRASTSYDMVHVDDFLDALVVALRQGRPVAPLVDMVRFSTVRFREGYDCAEVDQFLDDVVRQAEGGAPVERASGAEPEPGPAIAEVPVSYAEAPGVIKEQKGLLARLFRR